MAGQANRTAVKIGKARRTKPPKRTPRRRKPVVPFPEPGPGTSMPPLETDPASGQGSIMPLPETNPATGQGAVMPPPDPDPGHQGPRAV